jgi:hypothetical protein
MKKLALFISFIALVGLSLQSVSADCLSPTNIYMGIGPVEPCQIQQVSIPVYMNNPCSVGGFEIHIAPVNHGWIWFPSIDSMAIDTIGTRLTNWDLFLAFVNDDSSEISILGIGDLPGMHPNGRLEPGDGLLFTLHLNAWVYTQSDTVLAVQVTSANISDTTGYVLYNTVTSPGYVNVGASICDSNPRGDCNCDGNRNGIDVVYLVNYLKSIGNLTICGGCGGDANDTGNVNGIDVTFMVNYLKGIGPVPIPCD